MTQLVTRTGRGLTARRLGYGLLGLLALAAALAGPPAANGQESPSRIILFIGDGAGVAQWSAGLLAAGSLAVQEFPVVGLVDVRSLSGPITDSGASATAYATGVSTFNLAIGVGLDSLGLESVLDLAERRGMSTGLVATSSVVHATPAAFVAKVPNRYRYAEIAEQLAYSDVDVLLGGGRQFFAGPARAAGETLLDVLRARFTYVEDEAGLLSLDGDTVRSLAGLFAADGMPLARERSPTLSIMTEAALSVLDRDPEGFVLVVEGSQIDWRCHANAPLDEVVGEVLDFDAAIRVGLAYAEGRGGTLILVTADHETGGLALVPGDDELVAGYVDRGHTAELVPLFAAGPGASRFGGLKTNAEVGRLLLGLVGEHAAAPN